MDYATPAGTAPAGTDARPLLGELAELALFLHRGGASKVELSSCPHGGDHLTVFFAAGPASDQRGGQHRSRAQPRHPRGARAENWRHDPAADPGPKTQPRRRKANVQPSAQSPPATEPVALAPRQQEGGSNRELKKKNRSATRTAAYHLELAEAAKTQEAGVPEEPAPVATGELGAGVP